MSVDTFALLCESFIEKHPRDAARALEAHAPESVAALLKAVPIRTAALAVRHMDPVSARDALRELSEDTRAQLFAEFPMQYSAAALRRLPAETRKAVLDKMAPEKRRPLELLLSYTEGTAGALMDPCYLVLPEDIEVSEALERVRSHADECVFYVYVINRQQTLLGMVSIRELLMHSAGKRVSAIMQPVTVRLSGLTDWRSILANPDLKLYNALPVVSESGAFIGAVREEAVAHLESDEDEYSQRDSAHSTGAALGELFRLGLFGLVHSVEPTQRRTPPPSEKEKL